jgi:nucleotide-binding universal stress UspA family protein
VRRFNRIGNGIMTAIERHGTDLVIVGAQGHEMENFFVSSNTEPVIRLAPCPVLSLRETSAGAV